MTNFEKINCLVKHLQFQIDEGIIDEENCGSIAEEIFSAMEILSDCDFECEEAFKDDMKSFALLEGGDEQ